MIKLNFHLQRDAILNMEVYKYRCDKLSCTNCMSKVSTKGVGVEEHPVNCRPVLIIKSPDRLTPGTLIVEKTHESGNVPQQDVPRLRQTLQHLLNFKYWMFTSWYIVGMKFLINYFSLTKVLSNASVMENLRTLFSDI